MSMSKKDFIALADTVRELQGVAWKVLPNDPGSVQFMNALRDELAKFCACQNPRFMRDRWLAYIAGECGPNGGAIKSS